MKSIFVVSDARVNMHVGEEYDVIIEVADQPTTDNIQTYADQVMEKIRELWKELSALPGDTDKSVVVHLDGASPFAAMLVNLQIIMKTQEGIDIILPWDKPVPVEELDSESKEILKKLEQGK
jgi:hypothetical protein